ncbi:MAG: 1-deoxy-D-xylulose-5-phosphate synthase [Bacilli bacterium]|nr:1-deoxy-D-xylulose-5-phosphate synthase [Bacilli bacterium]
MYKILDSIRNPEDIKNKSLDELTILSDEIRLFLLENISKTGGHLGSNLGIVELTLSLFHTFDFKKDKIVFDVGHQCYPYKLLTGRKDGFENLRQYNGMSGFPKRNESPYDYFDTGHSSNSISAALGMARARDIKKEDYHVIAIIGDGALTGGEAFEALNDLGFHKTKMLVILNDNGMAISKNVGGMSNYLTHVRISPNYNRLRKKIKNKLNKKESNVFTKAIRKIKDSFRELFINSMFFDDLGLRYIGPVDGHNIKELNRVMMQVAELDEPVVLHVITEKGRGYKPAMNNPNLYHGVGKFNLVTGIQKSNKLTYSDAFGKALVRLAEKDSKIVAITAAMADGTGLEEFASKYPKRFFDVGIAEGHAVTLAAGLGTSHLKPVFAVYSTFLQRGFDQIIHDVCMQELPVVFAIDRAGLVGNDGETHQGVFDISYLSMIPNITVLAPKCPEEIEAFLTYAFFLSKPVAIRYPRGSTNYQFEPLKEIRMNHWDILADGKDIALIAVGNMCSIAMQVKEELEKNHIYPMVVQATFIKPLDIKMLKELAKQNYKIVTLEDGNLIGGFGSEVLRTINDLGLSIKIINIGYEDHFISHGNVDILYEKNGIDVNSIVQKIKKL